MACLDVIRAARRWAHFQAGTHLTKSARVTSVDPSPAMFCTTSSATGRVTPMPRRPSPSTTAGTSAAPARCGSKWAKLRASSRPLFRAWCQGVRVGAEVEVGVGAEAEAEAEAVAEAKVESECQCTWVPGVWWLHKGGLMARAYLHEEAGEGGVEVPGRQ